MAENLRSQLSVLLERVHGLTHSEPVNWSPCDRWTKAHRTQASQTNRASLSPNRLRFRHNKIVSILFAGIFDFSVPHLRALRHAFPALKISLLLSPARYANSLKMVSAVSDLRAVDVVVTQNSFPFEDAKSEPWLLISAGFPEKIGPKLLDCTSRRAINVHPSLLPSFPGADPVRRSLLSGHDTFGWTIHSMTSVFDGGQILRSQEVSIPPGAITEKVLELISKSSSIALVQLVQNILGDPSGVGDPQSEGGPEIANPTTPMATRVHDDELFLRASDSLEILRRKLRAAGIHRKILVEGPDKRLTETRGPQNLSETVSRQITVGNERVKVSWQEGTVSVDWY